jgi:hypothetical protein
MSNQQIFDGFICVSLGCLFKEFGNPNFSTLKEKRLITEGIVAGSSPSKQTSLKSADPGGRAF